jgi:hypothetical protein
VDRSSEEGIRLANKHFQQSAGYFEHVKEQLLPLLQSPPLAPALASLPCLSEECLSMCRQLMLAQAQLCFYEKAVKDRKAGNMKPAIIAKIALQTHKFYVAASQYCGSTTCAAILDISWFAISDFQQKCFHGAAEVTTNKHDPPSPFPRPEKLLINCFFRFVWCLVLAGAGVERSGGAESHGVWRGSFEAEQSRDVCPSISRGLFPDPQPAFLFSRGSRWFAAEAPGR